MVLVCDSLTYCLEMTALTEKQQDKMYALENNWVRRIAKMKRTIQCGSWSGKESINKKLVRSRLKWAGHVERMTGEKLSKSFPESGAEIGGEKDRLQYEDCMETDLERMGEEWRIRATDGGGDLETVDMESSERKVRTKKRKKRKNNGKSILQPCLTTMTEFNMTSFQKKQLHGVILVVVFSSSSGTNCNLEDSFSAQNLTVA